MRAAIRRTISTGVLVTALVGAMAACGDDSGTVSDPGASSTSASPSSATSTEPSSSATPEPTGPACAKVWKGGATLARGYAGCVQDGVLVKRDDLSCSSGQRIVRFDDHYYAALGGLIYQTESVLDKDRRYRDAVAVCRG